MTATRLEGKLSDDPNSNYLTDMKYRYHNISIPVIGRFHFGNDIQFFLEAGLYLSFCVSETIRGKNGQTDELYITTPPENFFNPGGLAGFGLRIPLQSNSLILKTNYHHSIWNTGVVNLTLGFQLVKKRLKN